MKMPNAERRTSAAAQRNINSSTSPYRNGSTAVKQNPVDARRLTSAKKVNNQTDVKRRSNMPVIGTPQRS
jgi:hypothetical protein